MLRGQVALVTGASRGIGRGIALQLGEAGATVYVTGRKPKYSDAKEGTNLPVLEETAKEITNRGGKGVAVYCDHSNNDDIQNLFDQIQREQNGRLDILVNNAYSAVNTIIDNAGKKFWEQDPLVWDEINNVGLRNHYICSVYASRMMIPRQKGLIVIVSSYGGLRYLFNVAYGIGKAACDRMAVDMAYELKKHNITAVSLWPGATKTELMAMKSESGFRTVAAEFFENAETTEYSGLGIVNLAADKNQLQKTGKVWLTADLADEYGFTDVDGRHPINLRSVKQLLRLSKWTRTSWFIPEWIKLPGWFLSAATSKL